MYAIRSYYDEHTNEGNGFSFTHYNANDMLNVINYAFDVYTNSKDRWDMMAERDMQTDFSWDKSAKKYIELYTQILCLKH